MKKITLLLFLPFLIFASDEVKPEFKINGTVVYCDSISIYGVTILDLACIPRVEKQICYFDEIEGGFYGGKVTGKAKYDLKKDEFFVDVQLSNVSINLFLGQFLEMDKVEQAGIISGNLKMTIPTEGMDKATGSASLAISNGSVISLPALARVVMFTKNNYAGLDSGKVKLKIEDGKVKIQSLKISNPAVTVKGSGEVDFDGKLDITLNPKTKADQLGDIILIGSMISNLYSSLTKDMAQIRITGTVDNIKIE